MAVHRDMDERKWPTPTSEIRGFFGHKLGGPGRLTSTAAVAADLRFSRLSLAT
jgi:hypothetical protein